MNTPICNVVKSFKLLYDAKFPIANGNIKNINKKGLAEYWAKKK